MLAQARAGGVHQVVTYKLDRLGRSLTHLAIIVGELQMRNVALICTSQGIDTSKQNPVGQAMQPCSENLGFDTLGRVYHLC